MVEKIINIKNIGAFSDYKLGATSQWNGSLGTINAIYAPNGTGKTTLSSIFQSLTLNDPKLLLARKSNNKIAQQQVTLKISDEKKLIIFQDVWNSSLKNIVVFNSHFIEDYLFTGSFLRKNHKVNLFKFLLGQSGIEHKKKCKRVLNQIIQLKNQLSSKSKKTSSTTTEQKKNNLRLLQEEFNQNIEEYRKYSDDIFRNYVDLTNFYLQRFNPNLKLIKFEHDPFNAYEEFRVFMVFEIHGKIIQFSVVDINKKVAAARFTMSEGDKNALALAFFLAHLEIIESNNKIVIFDDPMSSFDTERKNTTLNVLAKIASNCEQFFLLSHDLYFVKDFTSKLEHKNVLNLKIYNDGLTSQIQYHDIHIEVLGSLQKDLITIKNYLNASSESDIERREVIRCIRPILEGLFKIKYFDQIQPNHWLGDIISLIQKSDSKSRLFKLKSTVSDMILLNDYSKSFHHSGSSYGIDIINPTELKIHINIMMDLIDRI